MTAEIWVILAIIVIAIAAAAIYVVRIVKMSPEERKQLIMQWLIGAVTIAENAITENGAGVEKMEMVVSNFKKKAPLTCKIIMKITKTENLTDLIEKALETVKTSFEKK